MNIILRTTEHTLSPSERLQTIRKKIEDWDIKTRNKFKNLWPPMVLLSYWNVYTLWAVGGLKKTLFRIHSTNNRPVLYILYCYR